VEYGVRRNKHTCKQRYLCKKCCKTFVINNGFLNRKFSPEIVTLSLDLWSRGLSLRQIKQHIKQHHGVEVSHVTVLTWLRYYGGMIKEYTQKKKLDLGGEWQADEMAHYFKKHHNWLWNIIHRDKKFLITSKYSMFRNQNVANKVFIEASKMGIPKEVQTDGLMNYPSAIRRGLGGNVSHMRHAGLKSKRHMNIVERQQGTCRDRVRITRGFHSVRSAQNIWDCWTVFYNYVRPHMSLGGITPAEACGSDIELDENKWMGLIEASVKL
jgi:putative transposase